MNNIILSIKILDDLEDVYSDSISIKNKSYESILAGVKNISEPLTSGRVSDPTTYYFRDTDIVWHCEKDYDPENIANDLFQDGYYVYNRYNKYYVVAYALNYTKFEVYSKDCDKKLIKWRVDDDNDQVKGIIVDPNYNENPVITFMKKICSNEIKI